MFSWNRIVHAKGQFYVSLKCTMTIFHYTIKNLSVVFALHLSQFGPSGLFFYYESSYVQDLLLL